MIKPEYLSYLLVLILGLFFPVSAFSYYLFQRVKQPPKEVFEFRYKFEAMRNTSSDDENNSNNVQSSAGKINMDL